MLPFLVKDCALATLALGESAVSIAHMREILGRIPLSSIYYHFWGNRLRPSFTHPEYMNDFAHFAHYSLNDEVLSERFGAIDPGAFNDLEGLRRELIEIIEDRLDEVHFTFWTTEGHRFHFLRSITVVFDTDVQAEEPLALKTIMPNLSLSSIFYHFIDARRRTPKKEDDFSFWLSTYNGRFKELIEKIQHIDPYFLSLSEIKLKLCECFSQLTV